MPEFSVPEPSTVAPSEKVTVPVGVPTPDPDATRVAVRVTLCPIAAGFALLLRVAVDGLFAGAALAGRHTEFKAANKPQMIHAPTAPPNPCRSIIS